jgi:VWFA-related protein
VDGNGDPFEINPAQLVIAENGEPIPLDQIEGVGEVGPLTTLLLTDISGSMNNGGKLEAAKQAAMAYVDQMRPGDSAGLMLFNTKTTIAQPITQDQAALREAIDDIHAADNTAMYDALQEAIALLNDVSGRKAIIVLTDGLDNISSTNTAGVISAIGETGLSISTIGLGEPDQSTAAITALDEDALIELATQAGGVYGYANDPDSLSQLYRQYAIGLQSEYVITYISPASLRDGVSRSLSVTLSDPGLQSVVFESDDNYNPGGLIPEVSQAAEWNWFLAALGGLILLLIIPAAIGKISGLNFRSKKSRIKLLD